MAFVGLTSVNINKGFVDARLFFILACLTAVEEESGGAGSSCAIASKDDKLTQFGINLE